MASPPEPLPAIATDSRTVLGPVVAAVARGDRAALGDLYTRTSAKLYGICLRFLGDEAEAQDALQEVYMAVWRRAETFDASRGSPITWLSTIARNRSIDRRRARPQASEPIEVALQVADSSPSAFDFAVARQSQSRLSECLDRLDDQPRTMIRAAFLDGRSYAQLATFAEVPLPTMKSWIRRGLAKLRLCLES